MMAIDSILEKFNWAVVKVGNIIEWFKTGIGAWFIQILDRVAGAKVFVVFTVVWGVIRFAGALVVTVYNKFIAFEQTVNAASVAYGWGTFAGALAKLNVVFPVAEGLVLLGALGGLWVAALGLRWVLTIWKAIPLKAS